MIASTVGAEEEVAWDEESNSDSDERAQDTSKNTVTTRPTDAASSPSSKIPAISATTTGSNHFRTDSDAMTLKAPRRSHDEKSVADSEASYDLVSGAASHAAGSPKQKVKEEDSDDDWE